MALHNRNRIKRLEAAFRKCQAAQQLRRFDPAAWEALLDDPEWRALVRELYALIQRLIESGWLELDSIRQGIIADDRGREILCLLSEIGAGFRFDRTP